MDLMFADSVWEQRLGFNVWEKGLTSCLGKAFGIQCLGKAFRIYFSGMRFDTNLTQLEKKNHPKKLRCILFFSIATLNI